MTHDMAWRTAALAMVLGTSTATADDVGADLIMSSPGTPGKQPSSLRARLAPT